MFNQQHLSGDNMSTVEMYKPKFEVTDIFDALKKIKTDEILPEGGVFDFFYQDALYPGFTLFLRHKNRAKFFYIDHDDFIIEVKDQIPEWDISIDRDLVRISLTYDVHDSKAVINFVYNISEQIYRDLLNVIRKKKEIKLYYLSLLYGGLVFDSYKKIKIPAKIIDVMKKIK